jgi:hypothetical protein
VRALDRLIEELRVKVGSTAENAKTVHGLFLWALNPLGVISTFVFAFECLFRMPPVFGKHVEVLQTTLEGYLRMALAALSEAGQFKIDLYGLIRCGRVEKRVAFFTGAKSSGPRLESEDILAILSRGTKEAIPRYRKKQGVKIVTIDCPNFLRPPSQLLTRFQLLTMNFSDVGNGELLGKDWDLAVLTYNDRVKETIAFLKTVPRRFPRMVFALGGRPDGLTKFVDKSDWIELPREFLTLRDDDEKRSLLFEFFENRFVR